METIKEYLPFIVPIVIVQYGLLIVALIHALTHKAYRFGNRILWVIIIVLVGYLGPIAYFTVGRGEE